MGFIENTFQNRKNTTAGKDETNYEWLVYYFRRYKSCLCVAKTSTNLLEIETFHQRHPSLLCLQKTPSMRRDKSETQCYKKI